MKRILGPPKTIVIIIAHCGGKAAFRSKIWLTPECARIVLLTMHKGSSQEALGGFEAGALYPSASCARSAL